MIARPDSSTRLSLATLVGVLVATMAVFTFGGLPTAAHAAGTLITNESELITAVSALGGTDPTVTLGASFGTNASTLAVERTVTLDLAGNALFVKNIHLNPGIVLTITDSSVPSSGSLMAIGPSGLAGITTTGATLIVSSGEVSASGGTGAAGIGGDSGPAGDGGTVAIAPAASVYAAAAGTTSAIGAGAGGTSFGTFEVNGSLTLQSAELTVPVGATISGSGTVTSWNHITNNGTILPSILGNGNVSGNNFRIDLAPNYPGDAGYVAYQLYAPTLADAGITLPAPDRGPHVSLTRWTSELDGTGTTLTETTPLAGLPRSFYAQWAASGITAIDVDYADSPAAVQAGWTKLQASYTVGADTWDISDLVTFSSNVGEDAFDTGSFGVYIQTEAAGPRTVTGKLTADTGVSDTVQFEVVHSEWIGDISLIMTPTTVFAGRASTAYVSAVDDYDNPFGYNILLDPCDWCEFTVTSSDPTDVIDLATGRITLKTLGVHTITVAIDMGEGGFKEAEATVTVVAAPAALAVTGSELDRTPLVALLLLLLGLALVLRRRRARA